MVDISINWWAVIVAAVANMVVGYLWYGPVFGKMWKSLMGFTDESMKSMNMTPTRAMVLGFAASLVMAYVLALFAFVWGAINFGAAFELAFWVWLGFLATGALSGYLWEGKPLQLFILNAVEQLVAMVLMTAILVLWR